MFQLKSSWGDHKVFTYDVSKHPFIDYIKELFNEKELDKLHLKSTDYNKFKDVIKLGYLNDRDTDLHEIFYNTIKHTDKFKLIYCNFIKDIYKELFPNEKYMIYQSFPSIRIQYNHSVVVPPHYDSDHLSNHPDGEQNFIIPITKMFNTNSIYIESEPGKKDFKSVLLNPGELFKFNGNKCTHYNEKNSEEKLRISLDFRIILLEDYLNYINKDNIRVINPRDIELNREQTLMIVGKYYQLTKINEDINSMIRWYKVDNIIQHRPTFEKEEAISVYNYMLEDNFITEHKKTKELEKLMCDYIGCKHCIMTTSGTTAIILALLSLDLEEDSEVILPNYTMIATINAVKFLRLRPVIVDVNKDTFTLDINTIKEAISDKTKVILHVSLNNRYKDINEIIDFCNKNNLTLLEDSAQSLGCRINKKSLGTFGKIGCFSLSTPKIISTGQGGFCVTDDDILAQKMKMIKNFGRKESGKDNFEIFGLNFKYTDIQAVICIEQMKKLDYRIKRMRDIYDIYYVYLKNIVDMRPPLNSEWLPWFVDIFIDNRTELIDFLKKHNIQTRPVYGEINKTNIYYSDTILTNSNYCSNKGLFLPSYITLTDDDIIYICKLITLFYKG